MKYSTLIFSCFLVAFCTACATHSHHNDVPSQNLTLGKAQRELRKGMDQASVANAMGSPNIVTNDKQGNETWIYDKIASEVSYSQSAGGVWLVLAGVTTEKSYSKKSERTLTVLVKFNENALVESVNYHSSSF